ncbi:MAG: hypothetical protein HS115_18180 [Spirochaetales bacterium]|nr:hypothetical protein [Spirochaetales bacterium]
MPFYDFACSDCDSTMEVKASISQKEKGLDLTCPGCGSHSMQQVFRELSFIGAGSSSSAKEPAGRPAAPCGSHCGCYHG